jgi:diguanylate cyclase (GGDEF)-like protein
MGICNRRYMEKRLHSEFQRAKRYRHHLSLIMIDIDHFKKINDEHGHDVGDQLIALIANSLQEMETARPAYRLDELDDE